ncbi:MAG: hypothetical protein ACP5GJ_01670 [Nanopusillaceae archaeon]|jgi:hypothetical protein
MSETTTYYSLDQIILGKLFKSQESEEKQSPRDEIFNNHIKNYVDKLSTENKYIDSAKYIRRLIGKTGYNLDSIDIKELAGNDYKKIYLGALASEIVQINSQLKQGGLDVNTRRYLNEELSILTSVFKSMVAEYLGIKVEDLDDSIVQQEMNTLFGMYRGFISQLQDKIINDVKSKGSNYINTYMQDLNKLAEELMNLYSSAMKYWITELYRGLITEGSLGPKTISEVIAGSIFEYADLLYKQAYQGIEKLFNKYVNISRQIQQQKQSQTQQTQQQTQTSETQVQPPKPIVIGSP